MKDYLEEVTKSLHRHYGKDVELFHSTRKDKKFMVITPDGKMIHFGAKDYPDFYLDQTNKRYERRERFLKRNARWANADKYTPAHLSYYVLWN